MGSDGPELDGDEGGSEMGMKVWAPPARYNLMCKLLMLLKLRANMKNGFVFITTATAYKRFEEMS